MGGILLGLVLYPILGGLIVYGIGRKNKTARDYAADFVTITEFLAFAVLLYLYVSRGESGSITYTVPVLSMSFARDGFRLLYGTTAAFLWMITAVFSREYFAHYRNRNRYYLFFLITLGATAGVFLAGDLYTLFAFFEMMSFTSYVWVAQDERKESLRAAETYLAIAVSGGLVMLMGIFLWYDMTGTLALAELYEAAQAYKGTSRLYAAGICMLIGFGAKAGAFPLHIWLPKAHPVAPAPASALLSGILTKSGVLGILLISCNLFLEDEDWNTMLLMIGLLTMFGGALLALCSNDLKRTLACSSMSQIGFILVGISASGLARAVGGEAEIADIAMRGAFLHMINHSLIKLVLFLSAGVVFMNVHKLDLNDIRGFGRKKPLLHAVFLSGALGIGGIPLFNGYISKSLLHEGLLSYPAAEWIFLFSGGMTVAYMLKLYVCLFLEKNRDAAVQEKYDQMAGNYMNGQSAAALAAGAVILPVFGTFPGITMDRLADIGTPLFHAKEPVRVAYFHLENLKGAGISIGIGLLLYGIVVRLLMVREEGRTTFLERVEYDLDREKRKPAAGSRRFCGKLLSDRDIYVDIWPKWLDLENLIYRPILVHILPAVCGTVCRAMDRLADDVIVLLRKTVYRDSRLPHELPEGNMLTHGIGLFLDGCLNVLNKTIRRKHPVQRQYEHKLALLREMFSENNSVIARSLSFGLMLFCVGFLLTVFYLLL